MDVQAPAVVAVVVTTDPGPWFDETLTSLAAQDYEELSVLVLDTGDEGGVSERVGRILPEAFVRHLEGKPGYGAASNEALTMVEGAAFFLLCHDDVALESDAVHNLVEESFRSNAGVVSPKFVNWDDPTILLHVGMSCDKTGAVVDRVGDGEVDHGQHDAARDVFVAPGGCILIRADLWRQLDGFDAGIVAMGEDLDLSWRCQVAGSRIVVAPEARVRHREVVAGGLMPLSVLVEEGGRHPATMQELQRRHELRAVLKCYTTFHILRVLPQAAVLSMGEVVVALSVRDRARVRVVVGAWRWNAHHLSELRALRRQLNAHRLFPDAEVRRLQLHGSARLSQYFSRLSHQGLDSANAVVRARGTHGHAADDSEVALLTGSVGLAFSEDSSFDDLDDLGHRSGRDRFGRRVRSSPLVTGRQRVLAMALAAVIVVLGTRELVFGSLPMIGQLAPLPAWTTTWHHFFSGWQSAGVGTTAPASPAFGLSGLVGTVLFGAMGTAQRVLMLGCIPLGALGMSRFMRPLASPRARVVAVLCYLGLPLPYGALGTGRWDGLVAYAAFPFIVTLLARAAGVAPFDEQVGRGWRATRLGRIALLGAVIAAATSFAPATLPLVLACALAWEVGTLAVGSGRPGYLLATAGQAVALALVLCAPWALGTALAGWHSVDVFGLPISPAAAPSWGEVVRFAVGPVARSPIVWLLVAAAALPLVLGTGVRLAWASRLWVMACASWALAMASSHGWMGNFTPSETVVLAPAAVAVAAAIGLGVSSFENDLAGQAFGWRQVVTGVAVVAVGLGLLPVVVGAAGGRWDMPTSGVEQPLAFLNRPSTTGADRVLWLGDPRALPVGGWSIEPGLAYGLTPAQLPETSEVWTPAGPGPADTVAAAVKLAVSGETVHLGRLLAAAGVRYVVLVDGLAPPTPGLPASVDAPLPSGLPRALLEQNDLRPVPGEVGVSVFENSEVIPVTALRASPPLTSDPHWVYPGVADVLGWSPVLGPLDGPDDTGPVGPGDLYAGYAPAGSLHLTEGGGLSVARQPAFGWAAQFQDVQAGTASLHMGLIPIVPLAVLLELLGWVALVVALVGPRRRRPVPEPEVP
jgi:GT2 family glycosyltransferase